MRKNYDFVMNSLSAPSTLADDLKDQFALDTRNDPPSKRLKDNQSAASRKKQTISAARSVHYVNRQ